MIDAARAKTDFETVELFGKTVLLSACRIDRNTIPKGYYAYDLRHGDDWGVPCSIEQRVVVNYFGTVVSNRPIAIGKNGYRPISYDDMNYADSRTCTLADYMKEHPPKQTEKAR